MKHILAQVLFGAVLSVNVAVAKDFNNGCGSGWNEPLVPDSIGPLCVDFKAACSDHDNCYSRCLPGGDNFGKPICAQTALEQRESRRSSCDTGFLESMRKSCSLCDAARRPLCDGVASIYELAVRAGGKGGFNGIVVPDAFYRFLVSEKAKTFDFRTFTDEIMQVRNMPGVSANNKLSLDIRDDKPIAIVSSVKPVLAGRLKLNDRAVLVKEAIRYGSVDLSQAAVNGRTFDLNNVDIKKFDISKFRREQRFELVKP